MARILVAASFVEPDGKAVSEWYANDHIDCLGGWTAAELVERGLADEVLRFIQRIRLGESDPWPVH